MAQASSSQVLVSRVTLILVVALLLAHLFLVGHSNRIEFTEDTGLTLAVSRLWCAGTPPMIGPPSHTGGRHLGPIGYAWFAAPFCLLNQSPEATVTVLALVLQLTMMALAWAAVRSGIRGESRYLAIALTILVCLANRYTAILYHPWHNHLLLLFSSLMIGAASLITMRHPLGLGLGLLTASLLVQFHYSSIPLAIVMFCGSIFLSRLIGKAKLSSPSRLIQLTNVGFGVLALLTWIPLWRYESLFPGTLKSTLFPHLVEKTESVGIVGAIGGALMELYKFSFWYWPLVALPSVLEWSALVFLALSVSYFAFVALRDSAIGKLFCMLSAAGIAAHIIALAQVTAPVQASYYYALLPFPILILGVAFVGAFDCTATPGRSIRCWALVFLCTVIVLSSYEAVKRLTKGEVGHEWYTLQHAEEVSQLINRDRDGESITLLARSGSKYMHGAILSLLSPEHFSSIKYWEWLRELPQDRAVPEIAYLVSCPRFQGRAREELDRELDTNWQRGAELATESCTTCDRCTIRKYRARVGQKL